MSKMKKSVYGLIRSLWDESKRTTVLCAIAWLMIVVEIYVLAMREYGKEDLWYVIGMMVLYAVVVGGLFLYSLYLNFRIDEIEDEHEHDEKYFNKIKKVLGVEEMDMMELYYYIYMDEQEKKKAKDKEEEKEE